MTLILSLAGCAVLFLGIWGCTVTMPSRMLAKNFPPDVQKKLEPRLNEIDAEPLGVRRICGFVILAAFCAAFAGIFWLAAADGMKQGFNFGQMAARLLTIAFSIKAFDIVCLDWFLLTKTHFFQHYFPETEGCQGWQDFGYNRRQQVIHCLVWLAVCLLAAWLLTKGR